MCLRFSLDYLGMRRAARQKTSIIFVPASKFAIEGQSILVARAILRMRSPTSSLPSRALQRTNCFRQIPEKLLKKIIELSKPWQMKRWRKPLFIRRLIAGIGNPSPRHVRNLQSGVLLRGISATALSRQGQRLLPEKDGPTLPHRSQIWLMISQVMLMMQLILNCSRTKTRKNPPLQNVGSASAAARVAL